jgi:spore coat polysaccharide biosynthesis protein SpsF
MILAILQARVSSTRLPGKVLKPILGRPMLLLQIERVRRAQGFDKLLVATSTDPSDDAIQSLCRKNGVDCTRGSLRDVLDRFYQAALPFKPKHVVRLTGDCPLADPEVIDRVIDVHLKGSFDYTSNALEPTYPDGLDVEVVRFASLAQAWREATLPSHREHVTLYVHQHPERFRIENVRSEQDLSALRWTVDEPADLEVVKRIYEGLYPKNPEFTTRDILSFLDRHADLKVLNTAHRRNEGLARSLAEDTRTTPGRS